MIEFITIGLSSLFVLFAPGFAASFAIFPKTGEVDLIERVALSFALSIALIPLVVFYLNMLIGIPINLLNASIIVVGVILVSVTIYWIRKNNKKVFEFFKKIKKKR